MLDVTGLTDFVGYEADTAEGQVLAMVADGETVERRGGKAGRGVPQPHAFLRRVRGQIGDTGLIETETGSAVVLDTKHALQGLHGHRVRVRMAIWP